MLKCLTVRLLCVDVDKGGNREEVKSLEGGLKNDAI